MLAGLLLRHQARHCSRGLSSWANSDPNKFSGASPAQAYNLGAHTLRTLGTLLSTAAHVWLSQFKYWSQVHRPPGLLY